ncbi:MAG: hypothetical protein ACHBN1_13455 [Heteroscytonema crispum UTEX LB 1556]
MNFKTPETCASQHIIGICTESFQAKLEINRQWQSKSYATSDVAILPAHQITNALEFEQELGFIILSFEPEFLHRAAYESIDSNAIEILQQLQTHDPLIKQIGLALSYRTRN